MTKGDCARRALHHEVHIHGAEAMVRPPRLDILALSEQATHAHLEGHGREPIDDEISVEREGDALGDEVEGEG